MDFIKVGAACPTTRVSDINYNISKILDCIQNAENEKCKFLVFPELCITSYTCGDLFLQGYLIEKSLDNIKRNKKYRYVNNCWLSFLT